MTLFASVFGVFGDILGILILGIAVVAIYIVAQLFLGSRRDRAQWLDEQQDRERSKDKRAA